MSTTLAASTTQPRIELVPLSAIMIDPRYQRPLDEKRAEKIANEFHWDQFGVLELSFRENDTYAVFDGQHRLAAALKMGLGSVPAIIHQGLSAEEEAILFTLLQTQRKGLKQLDRFRAEVFGGDEKATRIDAIVHKHGFTFGNTKKDPNNIEAVAALERTCRRFGFAHLDLTLSEIRRLWDGDPGATNGKFIVGMAYFLADYGDGRYGEAEEFLVSVSPLALTRRAEAVHAGDDRAGRAVYAEIRKAAKVKGRPRNFKAPKP